MATVHVVTRHPPASLPVMESSIFSILHLLSPMIRSNSPCSSAPDLPPPSLPSTVKVQSKSPELHPNMSGFAQKKISQASHGKKATRASSAEPTPSIKSPARQALIEHTPPVSQRPLRPSRPQPRPSRTPMGV
ncbi:hypothetical protein E5D57_008635 [Metarhizium anisopliae]|nr:hypothetical protein E5D57_008635 [Metarhizium anisopliae]